MDHTASIVLSLIKIAYSFYTVPMKLNDEILWFSVQMMWTTEHMTSHKHDKPVTKSHLEEMTGRKCTIFFMDFMHIDKLSYLPVVSQIVNVLDLQIQGQICKFYCFCDYPITTERKSVMFGVHLHVNNRHQAIKHQPNCQWPLWPGS